jgi:hypothetical protein
MCRFSWNLGVSISWNPQGLSRPVMGFLYPYLTNVERNYITSVCFQFTFCFIHPLSWLLKQDTFKGWFYFMDTLYSGTPKMFGLCTRKSGRVPDSFYAETPYTLWAVYLSLIFINSTLAFLKSKWRIEKTKYSSIKSGRCFPFFNRSHPDVSSKSWNKIVSVKHHLFIH